MKIMHTLRFWVKLSDSAAPVIRYRSSGSSQHLSDWDGAQLWSNAKTAQKEAKYALGRPVHWYAVWTGSASVRVVLDRVEVIAINIEEPI